MGRGCLLVAFATLLALLASARTAEACTCMMPGPPCEAFGAAAAVFVGTVVDKSDRAKPNERGVVEWTPVVFKFTILQPFGGVEGAEAEVVTGRGGGDCGYQFRMGETYLVYAYGGRDGKPLTASICSRTKPLSQAADDLEFLRGLGARGPGASIDIRVMRSRRSGGAGEESSAGLGGARVRVEGEGDGREVRTDPEGRARLAGLKPGTYKIKLAPPEGLTTHEDEREVTIADRGCASVQYFLADDGRISGRVTDAEGRAVEPSRVTLAGPTEQVRIVVTKLR